MSATTLVVLVYDVADDRRRRKLHALLRQYGVAVQESAFEARLTRPERARLLERAARMLDMAVDRFVMYPVMRAAEEHVVTLGQVRPSPEEKSHYVV